MELKKFKKQSKKIKKQLPMGWGLQLVRRLKDDTSHPIVYQDVECAFVSAYLDVPPLSKILNVGSYNQYILGLLSMHYLTTLDIRDRLCFMNTEMVVTEDIKKTSLPSESFDVVISLSSIEHFGLGRYGDEIDLDADKKAFTEFKRLLKPDGLLFFTTTIKRGRPELLFNANKTYTLEIIHDFCEGLTLVEEMFISKNRLDFCKHAEVTDKNGSWDIYCGCYKK